MMDQILNQILDRTMNLVKRRLGKENVDDDADKATDGGKSKSKSHRRGSKKKKPDPTKDRTCCDVAVCSPPDSSSSITNVPIPQWVLEEHTYATISASELRRAILRLRRCSHWDSLHSACDCRRQRWNQWRSWDLHTHFCPKIGLPQYLQEEIQDDLTHLNELFEEHYKEMNETVWPSAYDLQCKRGRPGEFPLPQSSSSSSYSVSELFDSRSSGSGESAAREIVFDLLAQQREAPSSDSGDHWGDTGDYDERNFYPWENDPEPVKEEKETNVIEDDESADVVEVGFVQKETPGGEYYGPGPDGTRARPELPPPAPPFDATKGDDPLELEF